MSYPGTWLQNELHRKIAVKKLPETAKKINPSFKTTKNPKKNKTFFHKNGHF